MSLCSCEPSQRSPTSHYISLPPITTTTRGTPLPSPPTPSQAYEWYAVKFTDIVDDMATLFRKSASILDMGCGTSGFVDDARKAGWSNIIGGVVRPDPDLGLG